MDTSNDNGGRKRLVPDTLIWKDLNVSSMTGWRISNDPTLGFPPKIKIRGRNYRDFDALEAWKLARVRGDI
jgi:hypothetical protein